MTLKKTAIFMNFDEDALLELRRILFRKSLSLQEFFAFITECTTLGDERTEEMLQELCRLKTDEKVRGGVIRKNVNADSLYEAIEAQHKKDTENNNDLFEED